MPTKNLQQGPYIGQMDTRIVFERVTETLSSTGTPVETWATLRECFAYREMQKSGSDEAFQADQMTSITAQVFIVRYFDGLTEKDRISISGVIYYILNIDDTLGRKRFLKIYAEKRA
jgi:SPP1 family predicted phage head-tail adaptor